MNMWDRISVVLQEGVDTMSHKAISYDEKELIE